MDESEEDCRAGNSSIFDYLETRGDTLMRRLRDLSRFRTVSSDPAKTDALHEMAEYLVDTMTKFKLKSTVLPIFPESGDSVSIFPLILAETKRDAGKRTVCFYCHFDVSAEELSDNYDVPYLDFYSWRGNEDQREGVHVSKVPLLSILNALGAYQYCNIPLPVNVKIILDPLGTSEHDATGRFLTKLDDAFLEQVDFSCLSDGWWSGSDVPSVSHGCRGYCYFVVEIEGPSKDLHSGHYGGLINEPMTDVVYVLNQLVDQRGNVKIDGFYDHVPAVTKEEKTSLKNVEFNVKDFKESFGAYELLNNENKASLLANMWKLPSLTIHGIEGAYSGAKAKNVIPHKVAGKFSVNIVPNMSVATTKQAVFAYTKKVWKLRKSRNKLRIQMTVSKLPWYTNPQSSNCLAAQSAVETVFKKSNLIQNSNRIRMANVLSKITKSPVVNIGIRKYDNFDDVDEGTFQKYLVDCSKLFASYLSELGALGGLAEAFSGEIGEVPGEDVLPEGRRSVVDSANVSAGSRTECFHLTNFYFEVVERMDELKELLTVGNETYLAFLRKDRNEDSLDEVVSECQEEEQLLEEFGQSAAEPTDSVQLAASTQQASSPSLIETPKRDVFNIWAKYLIVEDREDPNKSSIATQREESGLFQFPTFSSKIAFSEPEKPRTRSVGNRSSVDAPLEGMYVMPIHPTAGAHNRRYSRILPHPRRSTYNPKMASKVREIASSGSARASAMNDAATYGFQSGSAPKPSTTISGFLPINEERIQDRLNRLTSNREVLVSPSPQP